MKLIAQPLVASADAVQHDAEDVGARLVPAEQLAGERAEAAAGGVQDRLAGRVREVTVREPDGWLAAQLPVARDRDRVEVLAAIVGVVGQR